MQTGATAGIRFVEFKSYQEETELAKGAINQFLGYLSDARLTSLNELLYVFNAKKLTDVNAAKSIMQKVFQGPQSDLIYRTIFPKIQVIFNLNADIETARPAYNILVADINSLLYKFVTIN